MGVIIWLVQFFVHVYVCLNWYMYWRTSSTSWWHTVWIYGRSMWWWWEYYKHNWSYVVILSLFILVIGTLYEMGWIKVLWWVIFKVRLLIESLLYCTLYYYLCLLIYVNDFDWLTRAILYMHVDVPVFKRTISTSWFVNLYGYLWKIKWMKWMNEPNYQSKPHL
jgi:hypothetical protein